MTSALSIVHAFIRAIEMRRRETERERERERQRERERVRENRGYHYHDESSSAAVCGMRAAIVFFNASHHTLHPFT